MYNICVVCLIGLPAAGKTTFSNRLLSASRDNLLDFGVISISFDNFLKWDSKINPDYKESRNTLLKSVESIITQLKNSSFNIDKIEILNNENCSLHNLKNVLIILDDNNYLKSMRYKIIQLCRRFELGYFQIYFQLDIITAKMRNSFRKRPIPNEVIEKMYYKFEPPSLNMNKIVTISNDKNEHSISIISAIVVEQINNPLMKIVQKEPVIIKPTIIHQIDIDLRKEISNRIKTAKISSTDIRELAGSLNIQRKKILEDIRSGIIDIDPSNTLDVQYFMN